MSRFLISVSGAAPDILQFFPAERAKYIAYGSMILATTLMSGLAVDFTLRIALVANFAIAAIVATVVGLLVAAVDRWLIVTVPRRDSSVRTLLMSVPRLAFGLLLSVVVAAPIILQVLHPEVDSQMVVLQMQHAETYYSQLTTSAIGERVNADQAHVDELVTEISRPGENSSAVQVARTELPAAQQALKVDQAQENQLKTSFEFANQNNAGFPAAISALISACAANGTINAISIILFMLFAAINLLPILLKTLMAIGPESAYEKAANYGDEMALQVADVMRHSQMKRIIREQT